MSNNKSLGIALAGFLAGSAITSILMTTLKNGDKSILTGAERTSTETVKNNRRDYQNKDKNKTMLRSTYC